MCKIIKAEDPAVCRAVKEVEMKNTVKITLPEDVKKIIGTIEEAGFEAYAVGGCVRDCLLSRVPT